MARGPRCHRPRMAVASWWSAEGRPPQVPDAEPMGTLRGHPGWFDGRGADGTLVLERQRTGRHRSRDCLLLGRQRVRPRRPEPTGKPDSRPSCHGGRRRRSRKNERGLRRRVMDWSALSSTGRYPLFRVVGRSPNAGRRCGFERFGGAASRCRWRGELACGRRRPSKVRRPPSSSWIRTARSSPSSPR